MHDKVRENNDADNEFVVKSIDIQVCQSLSKFYL